MALPRSAEMFGAPCTSADRGPRGAAGAAGRHGLAIFDLDRTLIRGSSLAIVGQVLLRRRILPIRLVLRELAGAQRYAHRGEAPGEADALLHRLLACVGGTEAAVLERIVDDAIDVLERRVYPDARALLDAHKRAGDVCILISASPEELVATLGRRLGFDLAFGTRAEVRDGRLTGRLDGPFCHGAGKVTRLRAELGAVDLGAAIGYSDSATDLPLLEACGEAVAVNPDRALSGIAASRSWRVIQMR